MNNYLGDGNGRRSTELEEALDRSLALLERGRTPEECLDRFPEHAEKLRPLLEVAVQIRRVPAPTPPPTLGADGKQRMLEALAQKQAARPGLGARLRAWVRGLFEGGAEQGVDLQRLLRSAAAAAAVVVLIAVGAVVLRSWRGMTVRQEAVLRPEGGLVEVLPSGADAWLPVSEAMLVQPGDRIRTGAEGSAELMFFDGSITALRQATELTIARMASRRTGREKVIVLHQWAGEAYNQVQPLVDEASRFSVETASTVVSVRGTAFTLIVEPDGGTRLKVHEGTIEVQTRETSVVVSGGEEIQVEAPQASATPTRAPTPEPTEIPISPSPTEPPESLPPTGSPESLRLTGTPQPLEATATPQPAQQETEEPRPSSPDEPQEPSSDDETEEPKPSHIPPGLTKTPEPPGQTVPPGQEKKTPGPSNNDKDDKDDDDGGGGKPKDKDPPGKGK